MHFRYAFAELSLGKSPQDMGWLIHQGLGDLSAIGTFPRNFTQVQKEVVLNICSEADIEEIASGCKFPDWLGYLGLVIEDMNSHSEAFQSLSSKWASQLMTLVSQHSWIYARLKEVSSENGILSIKDLEACEESIQRLQYESGMKNDF